jgi:hypothetical protein
MEKQYGFILKEPEASDFKLGSEVELGGVVIQPDGQYDQWLPDVEIQNANGVETQACTSFGTLNCFEILSRRLFNQPLNFSDRFSAITSDTDPNGGNDPKKVIETARKQGLIPETDLPFGADITDVGRFYSPKPMWQQHIETAIKFLSNYVLGYEWAGTSPEAMKEALKFSPLGVAGYAWMKDVDGLYYAPEDRHPNHWFCVYGFEDGKYWKIWDSYDGDFKKLRWDFKFWQALRYSLEVNTHTEDISFLKKIVDALIEAIKNFVSAPKVDPQPSPSPLPSPTTTPPKPSRITTWGEAIKIAEGYGPGTRSFRDRNPGNFKFTELTASWGGKKGDPAPDGGFYCTFETYELGFQALCKFLTLGAKDNLKAYHQHRTLNSFMSLYANVPLNHGYIKTVAATLKVEINYPVKNFL